MDFPQLTATRREFLERATAAYHAALMDKEDLELGHPGRKYLWERGFTPEAIRYFRLGYVAEPLEGHDWFAGRLAIPYITPSGVSAIRFRRIDGTEERKYDQELGSLVPLFNVRDLHRPESYVAICEGELDTITMSALCGVPAVGLGGVEQWSSKGDIYRRLFEDYQKVFVVMDPDDAGQKIARAIVRVLSDPTNVVLNADVNDTYLLQGPEHIRKALGLE